MNVKGAWSYLLVSCVSTLGFLGLGGLVQASTTSISSAVGPSGSSAISLPRVPTGFNPLRATPAELATYGFPPKPPKVDSSALASWTNAMLHAKNEVSPKAVQGSTLGSFAGTNWAGYYDSEANNPTSSGPVPYDEVSGNWTVPTVPADNSTNEVGSWVGLGGVNPTGDLQQAGVISVASSPQSYYFFWEDGAHPILQGPVVKGGDTVYVDIVYNTSTAQMTYYLENLTTGAYDPISRSTLDWNGSSAEFEFEMPESELSLPSYPTEPFYGCYEWQGNTLTTVTAANSTETKITQGGAYAYPSSLGTETDGFQEIFGHS